MNVEKIRLIHFRNFVDSSIQFYPSINIFIGNNAQGKTNIIESIYTLLKGDSYRTTNDLDLINWNYKKSYILGEIQQREKCLHINILFQNINKSANTTNRSKKIIKVNKKFQKKSWLFKNIIR